MSLKHLCKTSILLSHKCPVGTREYLELFDLNDTEDERIIAMANTIMELTRLGKFDIRDFQED